MNADDLRESIQYDNKRMEQSLKVCHFKKVQSIQIIITNFIANRI